MARASLCICIYICIRMYIYTHTNSLIHIQVISSAFTFYLSPSLGHSLTFLLYNLCLFSAPSYSTVVPTRGLSGSKLSKPRYIYSCGLTTPCMRPPLAPNERARVSVFVSSWCLKSIQLYIQIYSYNKQYMHCSTYMYEYYYTHIR